VITERYRAFGRRRVDVPAGQAAVGRVVDEDVIQLIRAPRRLEIRLLVVGVKA